VYNDDPTLTKKVLVNRSSVFPLCLKKKLMLITAFIMLMDGLTIFLSSLFNFKFTFCRWATKRKIVRFVH